jgi:hypothetical protein
MNRPHLINTNTKGNGKEIDEIVDTIVQMMMMMMMMIMMVLDSLSTTNLKKTIQ